MSIILMNEFGKRLENVEYYQRPGSYGVIIKKQKIGVVKSRVFNKYFLVGGGIKNGETEIEALKREIIEEIGFKVEIYEKIGVATEYFYAQLDRKYIAKICNFYRIELEDKIQSVTENQLIWIDKNSLREMYHRSHQWIVEAELDRIQHPKI